MAAVFYITDTPDKPENAKAARRVAYETAVIWWVDRWNNTHPVDPRDHAGRAARATAAANYARRQIDIQLANGTLT